MSKEFSFFLLFTASILTGFIPVLGKKLTHTNRKSIAYSVASLIVSTFVSLPFLFIQFQISLSWNLVLLILLSCVFYGLSITYRYEALKNEDVSVVSIIRKISVIISVMGGIIFFKEKFTLFSYIGLLLLILSSIILIFNKNIKITSGGKYALSMAILSAIATIFDKKILMDMSPFTYVVINNFLSGLFLCFRKNIFKESIDIIKNQYNILIPISILAIGSWTVFLIVLKNFEISKSMPIFDSLSLLSPVILGIIIFREIKNIKKIIIASVLAMIGIILI